MLSNSLIVTLQYNSFLAWIFFFFLYVLLYHIGTHEVHISIVKLVKSFSMSFFLLLCTFTLRGQDFSMMFCNYIG